MIPKNKQRKISRGKSLLTGGSRGSNVVPNELLRSGTQHMERWMPVFPARTKALLRYADTAGLTGTSGAVATYVLSANGLYDPDITGTGHQPMGFDQLMLSYNHYAVIKSKIFVTFRNDSSASQPTVLIGLHADATPITVPQRILEFGLCNSTTLEFKGVSGSTKSLEMSCDIKKFQGVQDVTDDTELHGTAAANPAEQTYWHVQLWDSGGLSNTSRIDFVVEYEAWFLEPRELTESLRTQQSAFNRILLSQLRDEEQKKRSK